MNVNQLLLNKRMKNAKKRPVFQRATLMGPPLKPPIKKKESTSSSSNKWGHNGSSTIRSMDTSSASQDSEMRRCIIALTEGRGHARCEVGLACIDLSSPSLVLCQISDTYNYTNTSTKINILNPTEIIVPATFLEGWNNRLVEAVKKQFPTVKLIGAARKTFNNTNGMERIVDLCLPSINTICVGLQYRSYAVAAAGALLAHLQNSLAVYYGQKSMNVIYQEAEGYAVVDVSTADQLELVSCTKPAEATRYSTLFGVLNRCYTNLGRRSLRSSILQPPCHVPYIEERLDCVAELMKYPEKLTTIQALLQKLRRIDQLLTITTLASSYVPDDNSNRKLNYLLLLNSSLDLIAPLKDALEGYKQPFLVEFRNSLSSDNFNNIKELLSNTIHTSAHVSRGEGAIYQRCFAIKPEINGLLDLVRRIYSERLEDMREYVKHLGNKYNLQLALNNNSSKGYHIVMKLTSHQKRSMGKNDLPPQFIQVYRLGGSFTFKTMELIDCSTRLDDILFEIMKISNIMIQDILTELKKYIGFFFKLCEDIARLDFLQSLASVSSENHYTRPTFGDFTDLKDAQHPMLQFLCNDTFIVNPIFGSNDYNVSVITGPNGAGKSIYIRQVMLLQVMAQVGCYVPASSAIFRPADRMFARVYLEDDISRGASAFTLEMREVLYMLNVITDNSLYIIDELCRSTSHEEGTALAMAICERFFNTSAFVYFATHYTHVAKLGEMYLNVKTWQMESQVSGHDLRSLQLKCTYRLTQGVNELERYAVCLLKKVWPQSTMEFFYQVMENVGPDMNKGRFVAIDQRIRLKYDLEAKLRQRKANITRDEFDQLINEYKSELSKLGVNVNITFTRAEASRGNYKSHTDGSDNTFRTIDSCGAVEKSCSDASVYFTVSSTDNTGCAIEDDEEVESQMLSLMDEYEASQISQTNSLTNWNDQNMDKPFTWLSSERMAKEQSCLFPNVIINEGPDDPSIAFSSGESIDLNDISMSYSPEASPPCDKIDGLDSGTTDKSLNQSCRDISMDNRKSDTDGTTRLIIESDSTSEPKMKVMKNSVKQNNSSSSSFVTYKRAGVKRFIPPKKLTKREIQEEFSEQDRKLYEDSLAKADYSKYVDRVLNRPSIRQIQQAQHLVVGRKTVSGVEVIPLEPRPLFKKKKNKFQRLASSTSFEASIFSDKNAKPFEEFINSSKRKVDFFNFQPYSDTKPKSGTKSSYNLFNSSDKEDSSNKDSGGFSLNVGKEASFNASFSQRMKISVDNIRDEYLNSSTIDPFEDSSDDDVFESPFPGSCR